MGVGPFSGVGILKFAGDLHDGSITIDSSAIACSLPSRGLSCHPIVGLSSEQKQLSTDTDCLLRR